MKFKKNQWYESKNYDDDKQCDKYIRINEIWGNFVYYTIFSKNFIEVSSGAKPIDEMKDMYKELPKTLQTLCVGDIVTDGNYYRKVLGVINQNCYVMSARVDDLDSGYLNITCGTDTAKDLEAIGYKPYTPEKDVKEMTVKEISDKLGFEVKIIKE